MPTMFAIVCLVATLSMGAYSFYTVGGMLKLDELPIEERKAQWPAKRDRMLTAAGLWQYTVGLVLISMGSWPNSVALFFMGTMLILGVRFNRKLDEAFDGHQRM